MAAAGALRHPYLSKPDVVPTKIAAGEWIVAEHPPTIQWRDSAVMPLEIPPDHPVVGAMSSAGADVGPEGHLWGLDSWYDGATFTHFADTPAIAYGPAGFSSAVAHAQEPACCCRFRT